MGDEPPRPLPLRKYSPSIRGFIVPVPAWIPWTSDATNTPR